MRRLRTAFAPMNRKQTRPCRLALAGMVALILGAILLACGVVLFVSAHWDQIGPGRAVCAGDGHGGRLPPGRGLGAQGAIAGFRRRCMRWGRFRPARRLRWWGRSSIFRSTGRRRFCCGPWRRGRVGSAAGRGAADADAAAVSGMDSCRSFRTYAAGAHRRKRLYRAAS